MKFLGGKSNRQISAIYLHQELGWLQHTAEGALCRAPVYSIFVHSEFPCVI